MGPGGLAGLCLQSPGCLRVLQAKARCLFSRRGRGSGETWGSPSCRLPSRAPLQEEPREAGILSVASGHSGAGPWLPPAPPEPPRKAPCGGRRPRRSGQRPQGGRGPASPECSVPASWCAPRHSPLPAGALGCLPVPWAAGLGDKGRPPGAASGLGWVSARGRHGREDRCPGSGASLPALPSGPPAGACLLLACYLCLLSCGFPLGTCRNADAGSPPGADKDCGTDLGTCISSKHGGPLCLLGPPPGPGSEGEGCWPCPRVGKGPREPHW